MAWKRFPIRLYLGVFVLMSFALNPNMIFAKEYTMGIVGISSSVSGKDGSNMKTYIDMRTKEDPIEFANGVFMREMNVWLNQEGAKKGIATVDLTEEWTEARRNEAILQLSAGDPSIVVKAYTEKPDYLMYGNIAKFTVTHRESLGTNNIAIEVRLSARIVEADTGKIVFVGIGKGTADNHDIDIDGHASTDKISEYGWNIALEKAMEDIMKKLVKEV